MEQGIYKNSEARKKYLQNYYEENKARIRERQQAYYQKNKEKRKQQAKEYYEKRKKKLVEKYTETIYVKYGSEEPHLPVAVADSPKELAEMTGSTPNSINTAICRKRPLFAKIKVEPEMWPDNDGGMWFYSKDGKTVTIKD